MDDEIGALIKQLKAVLKTMDDPARDTFPLSGTAIATIIRALERRQRSTGKRGRPAMGEIFRTAALIEVLKIKEKLIKKGWPPLDAEAEAAKKGVPIFYKFTGHKLKPGYIQRMLQGQRSPRPRNPDAKS